MDDRLSMVPSVGDRLAAAAVPVVGDDVVAPLVSVWPPKPSGRAKRLRPPQSKRRRLNSRGAVAQDAEAEAATRASPHLRNDLK
jgi:hypothetical protein